MLHNDVMTSNPSKIPHSFGRARLEPLTLTGIWATVALISGTVALSIGLREHLSQASVHLLFLLSVLIASVRFGFWTGVIGAVLAFLSANFFFVEPLYSFRINHFSDWVTLFVLFVSGATTGFLVGRLREEADVAAIRSRSLELMREFSSELTAVKIPIEAIDLLINYLPRLTNGSAFSLVPHDGKLIEFSSSLENFVLSAQQREAATAIYSDGFQAPGSSTINDQHGYTYRFLGQPFGVVGYQFDASTRIEIRHACNALVEQTISTLEKLSLTQEAELAQKNAQKEALRSALLSSLSHDLRTPLSTILGGVSSLRELGDIMPAQARSDTLLAVEEEAGRLARYVENLLQMTRLNIGLDLRNDWIDPNDVLRSGVARARRAFSGRNITMEARDGVPLINADPVLLEQALFNLIDNAIKFSDHEQPVTVGLTTEGPNVCLYVLDVGVGIPASETSLVTEAFYRANNHVLSGSGLGLAISKGIISAFDGQIVIESPVKAQQGTRVSMMIPYAKGTC